MICSAHSAHIILTLCGFAVFVISYRRRISTNGEHDGISELPDDILFSIIMRMAIKDSTRTSVLSRRWRNLYKLVPDIRIEFGCSDLIDSSSYTYPHDSSVIVKAVDRFVSPLFGPHRIRSFRFRCCLTESDTNQECFEQWIRSLGKSGVEELFLQFSCRFSLSKFSFSCSLLPEMPSLKSLKLVLCYLQPSMKRLLFKTQLCKSLQILILHHVFVNPGALDCILSTCSSLHTLAIDTCWFKSGCELSFSRPNLQLKFLYIVECSPLEKISLYASNLTTFEFKGTCSRPIMFDHVPRLQSVSMNAHLGNILSYVRGKLAGDLPQLKCLAVTTTLLHLERWKEGPVRTNTARNLRQLDIMAYGPNDMNLLSLIPLLQSCPLLEDFHIDTSILMLDEAHEEIKLEEVTVLPTELKKVELSEFKGAENELGFALCILKSAVGLELMHISRVAKVYKGFGYY